MIPWPPHRKAASRGGFFFWNVNLFTFWASPLWGRPPLGSAFRLGSRCARSRFAPSVRLTR